MQDKKSACVLVVSDPLRNQSCKVDLGQQFRNGETQTIYLGKNEIQITRTSSRGARVVTSGSVSVSNAPGTILTDLEIMGVGGGIASSRSVSAAKITNVVIGADASEKEKLMLLRSLFGEPLPKPKETKLKIKAGPDVLRTVTTSSDSVISVVDLKPKYNWKKEQEDCVVCLDNPRQGCFISCRHIACCFSCGKELTLCPVCRQEGLFLHFKEPQVECLGEEDVIVV
jgi:hypothetical protein